MSEHTITNVVTVRDYARFTLMQRFYLLLPGRWKDRLLAGAPERSACHMRHGPGVWRRVEAADGVLRCPECDFRVDVSDGFEWKALLP